MTEVWLAAKSEAISKVRRTKGGTKGGETHCPDVKEVEKTFWLSWPDGWVIVYCCQSMKNCSEDIDGKYSDLLVV